MDEIKKMLEMRGEQIVDYGLNWSNARISAYSDIIESEPNAEYYGIELQEDHPLPEHYTRIDHHNDYSNRPAAILQVTTLLGIEPDRHVMLVAANDAGYIPALRAKGASDAEIEEIRRCDRSAQGVTADDESKAEQSIKEHLVANGSLIIVKSLTPHFSPICDRLFPYHRLLIFTDNEWTLYGDGKDLLTKELSTYIAQKRIYHGGGASGYIGAANGAFSKQEILDFVTSIKQRYEYL